ncbi:MAG: TolC family protein [Chitinophagaceae bacterium]|nr:MAG: TolC family protein [Chitinophagaceae bacterium]
MKRLLIYFMLFPFALMAQDINSLNLQKANNMAQQNYPLIKQRDLIKQTTGYTVDNLSKGFLPQLSLSGQATYQSEVTQVKVPVPGFNIESLNKDQYKILADVNQLIYDGGVIKQQKNIQQLGEEVEQQKVEVELYKLKERINQLFLGVLYVDEQLKQVDLVKEDLNNGIKRVEAQVNNGVAFRSNLNVLKAELLKADQRIIELKASRKGFTDILGLFINQALPEDIKLEKPVVEGSVLSNEIQRPELKLYTTQEKLLGGQFQLIDSRNKPKASLFWQGGYGRPGLNFLKNEFDFFYTTGLRLNWAFGGLYTQKKEKKIVELNQKTVNIQKEVFLLNTNTELKQKQSEVNKLQKLITTDKEIIDLRIKVKDAAKAQLENGVITANDYLREVNAEDQSRQSLITHEVQLIQAQINYQTISGKQ